MKEKMVININNEVFFKEFIESICNQYSAVSKEKITPNKIKKGYHFEFMAKKGNRARVKITDYVFALSYHMDYRSDRFHRISGIDLKKIDEDHTEIIMTRLEGPIKNGLSTVDTNKDSEIREASFKTKWQMNKMIKAIKKELAQKAKNNDEPTKEN